MTSPSVSRIKYLARQRSLWIALALWCLLGVAAVLLCRNGVPLNRHGAVSVIFVLLTFFPAGLMKSFLTMRTGNAWVHMWSFHAVTPHVMVDTRLVVRDFNIH